jgi:hypothetical protein
MERELIEDNTTIAIIVEISHAGSRFSPDRQ